MPQTKQAELDKIKAEILKKGVGSALAATATNLVFGDGDSNAEIVFIGEAPGKSEDEQGLPFVGAAGKFLNEMLATINLNRSQVYITNIVKYRPPNNRDPLPEEKAEFFPYLERQIEIIRPLLTVTLGRHSMTCFLPQLQISQVHGQPKRIKVKYGSEDLKDLVILPLFHPAAALYNGAMRTTLMEDFAKIPEILRLIRQEK